MISRKQVKEHFKWWCTVTLVSMPLSYLMWYAVGWVTLTPQPWWFYLCLAGLLTMNIILASEIYKFIKGHY